MQALVLNDRLPQITTTASKNVVHVGCEIMMKCWEPDPQDRPTFPVLKEWLEEVSGDYFLCSVFLDKCRSTVLFLISLFALQAMRKGI